MPGQRRRRNPLVLVLEHPVHRIRPCRAGQLAALSSGVAAASALEPRTCSRIDDLDDVLAQRRTARRADVPLLASGKTRCRLS